MLRLTIQYKFKTVTILILFISLSLFYTFHIFSMWQKALILSKDASSSLSLFTEASEFLSQNMSKDDFALVPMREVFYILNPQLEDNLIDYKSLWNSQDILLQANTTTDDILKVRKHLINFLKENSQVRYIIRDWNDPYAIRLFETTNNDELMVILREVKIMRFTLSTGWRSEITIYENVKYNALFTMNFSTPPPRSFTIPLNTNIQYNSSGVTFWKSGQRISYHFSFRVGMNFSNQNYLSIQMKTEIEDPKIVLTFYYDKNRDGSFNGYDSTDYIKSWTYDQYPNGWIKSGWNKIYPILPKSYDPIIEITIIITGSKDGWVTLKDMTAYTEITK